MTDLPDPDKQPDAETTSGRAERQDVGRQMVASNRYSLLVGLVFAVIAAIALFNAISKRDTDTLGFGNEERGSRLAVFAVPDVSSALEGDANVDPEKACEVNLPGAIRLCDFADRPLVISFWFTRGGECEAQQDVVSAVSDRFGSEVGFLSINVRDDREDVAAMAKARGWTMPVGHDRDGALANLYRVGGCPTFVFARPGLRLEQAVVGELNERELSERVDDLLRTESGTSPGTRGADGASEGQ